MDDFYPSPKFLYLSQIPTESNKILPFIIRFFIIREYLYLLHISINNIHVVVESLYLRSAA